MGQSARSTLGGCRAGDSEGRRVAATKSRKKIDEGNSDVKKQVESDLDNRKPIYQLVNVKTGGGKLIEIIKDRTRQRSQTSNGSFGESLARGGVGDRNEERLSKGLRQISQQELSEQVQLEQDRQIDEQIRELVEPLLYNGGRGKLVPLTRIWQSRLCGERYNSSSSSNQEERDNEYTGVDGHQTISFDNNNHLKTQAISSRYRWVCWKLEERGFVGETALHICFLLSSPSHMILAQKLLRLFPMLINDIYTCDEYFGESSLHMAIVNEDVKIVKLLLDHGANVHERCLGSFFLPNDQKEKANGQVRRALEQLEEDDSKSSSRTDDGLRMLDLQSNLFSDLQTNYEGYTYWGEYPLSFAASLGLSDCYKLLLAKGANPNRQDSNGNSTLHICVLSNRVDMFDLCYSNGANLYSTNKLGFTPLTLAAKLRRVNMFFHILTIMRQVNWIFCNVGFVDMPLDGIDSINIRDGSCEDHSVLSIVVSGVSPCFVASEISLASAIQNSNEHLQMLDGLLSDLLQVKWSTSIRGKFYSWLLLFILFLVIASLVYLTRFRFRLASGHRAQANVAYYYKLANQYGEIALVCAVLYYLFTLAHRCFMESNSSPSPSDDTKSTTKSRVLARHKANSGPMKILVQAPELMIFTFTCFLIILCVPLRLLFHWREAEDFVAALVMFLLPMKLLFFCRGSKSLGSFIVMIYKILMNDVLCFVVFLIVFIAGFGQSFVLIFKTYRPRGATSSTVMSNNTALGATSFFESLVREEESYFLNFYDGFITLHMMALNEFSWVIDEFNSTDYPNLARVLFCVYMILVSILLINMLIAMLGKTYQDISSQPNENLRQWARALLTVERMCSQSSRLAMLDRYSHQTSGSHSQFGATSSEDQNVESRCYSSTKALSADDLVEINFIKQLNGQNRASSFRLARKHLPGSQLIA